MRIKSPVGEYDYRVTAVRLSGTSVEIDGSLGMWNTTLVLGPREWAPVAAVAGFVVLALSRRR